VVADTRSNTTARTAEYHTVSRTRTESNMFLAI
jgi:hypothetical protein